jgi:protein SCO1/2
VACCALALAAGLGRAGEPMPPALQGVTLEMRLNAQVPLDLTLRDEKDQPVELRELLLPDRPAVLLFAYYRCPMLCGLALNRLAEALRDLPGQRGLRVGESFSVITVSFDPREGPGLAAAKKATYLRHYEVPGAETGWHFLTGRAEVTRRLADTVGFRYRYDLATGQYAHASGLLVLTPAGKIARVLDGVDYPVSDLYYALVEAGEYRIGKPAQDRAALLFCYSYDPARGRYQMGVINFVRGAALATLLGLGLLVWRLRRIEKRRAAACGPGSETLCS